MIPKKQRTKIGLVLICVSIITFVYDTSVNRVFHFDIHDRHTDDKTAQFAIIVLIFGVVQFFILEFARGKNTSQSLKQNLFLNLFNRIVPLVQYILLGILLIIIVQIFWTASYDGVTLVASTALSYSVSMVIMGLLVVRFFSWYSSNRNIVLLLYGMSSTAIIANMMFAIISVALALQDHSRTVTEFIGVVPPFFTPSPFASIINYGYYSSTLVSFISTWAATAFLLRHHYQRSNKYLYSIMMSVPLMYFLLQFQPIFNALFSDLIKTEPVLFGFVSTLLFTWSKPIAGLLFGFAFFLMARKKGSNETVKDFAITSAYGFMLLFVTNQAGILFFVPYPPFGLATISFIGVSAYLLLVGIYASAISMSQDSSVRKMIRKSILRESNLVDILGVDAREEALAKRVVTMARKQAENMSHQTGVKPTSDDDIRQYLDMVLAELRAKKARAGAV
jgi:hypothetical protein